MSGANRTVHAERFADRQSEVDIKCERLGKAKRTKQAKRISPCRAVCRQAERGGHKNAKGLAKPSERSKRSEASIPTVSTTSSRTTYRSRRLFFLKVIASLTPSPALLRYPKFPACVRFTEFRPLRQQILPASAAGSGRMCCPFSAKSHAQVACSVVNALATALFRYQLFAGSAPPAHC